MAVSTRRRSYGYAPKRLRRHIRPRLRSLGMLLGTGLVAIGVYMTLCHFSTESRYHALARAASPALPASDNVGSEVTPPGVEQPSQNWRQLLETNDDIGAWVRLEGTTIDLPVMLCGEHDGSYYLCHDLWGNYAFEGVPFLDHRCNATGMHRLVYGHRLSMGGQFSELQRAYEQGVFDTLGACHWYLPDGSETTLLPAFSLSVDMWFGDIQQFDFDGHEHLRDWLIDLSRQASASSSECDSLVSEATSVVTLVTCSSDIGHQEWRTLTVFVSPEAEQVADEESSPA